MLARLIQISMIALSVAVTVSTTGCAVARDQQTVGAYIDDTGITTAVKARLADDPKTSAIAINVETLNGVVQLSGFAKSQAEKDRAEQIAGSIRNVSSVKNNIIVRP